MTELAEIIARWDSGEGKPYKGRAIDWSAYGGDGETPPADIGCMCAQGQVLHLLGGWSPRRLRETNQTKLDLEAAKMLNISISHAVLLRQVNDSVDGAPSIVLTAPEKVLGPNAQGVLAIWRHFDAVTGAQWRDAWDAWDAWGARGARDAWDARGARDAWGAWGARGARDAWAVWGARDAWAVWGVAFCAVAEMAGVKWMAEHETGAFVFLPMFGFANPEAVLAAYPGDSK